MSRQLLIKDVVTPSAFEQVDKLDGKLLSMVEQFEKAVKTAGDFNRVVGQAKGNNDLPESVKKLTAEEKALLEVQKQIETTYQRRKALSTDLGQILANERKATADQNKELSNQAKLAAAAEGSIDQLRAKLIALNKEYDSLSEAERNTGKGTGLLTQINGLDGALKKLEGDTGRFQRNVGNYTGALSILQKELQDVKTKLDAMTKAGQQNSAEGQQLTKQSELLTAVVSRQSEGFINLTSEIRTTQKQLATMAAEGLQGTEAFQQLSLQLAQATQGLNRFNQNQKILSAELPAVAALTLAAKGLAGIYAIGAGAAALFADGNEKVEKELNKLVAIMTLLQGLNEAHELLAKRATIATVFRTTSQKGLNAVMQAWNFILKGTTKATVESTVAQDVNAKAINTTSTAMKGAATWGTILRAVLVGLGIAVFIGLIVSLASFMSDLGKETKATADAFDEFNKRIDESKKLLEDEKENIDLNTKLAIEAAKQRNASEKEINDISIKGMKDQQAAQKETAEKNGKELQSYVDFLGFQLTKGSGSWDKYNELVTGSIASVASAQDQLDRIKKFKLTDQYKDLSDEVKKTVDSIEESTQKVLDFYKETEKGERSIKLQEAINLTLKLAAARELANKITELNLDSLTREFAIQKKSREEEIKNLKAIAGLENDYVYNRANALTKAMEMEKENADGELALARKVIETKRKQSLEAKESKGAEVAINRNFNDQILQAQQDHDIKMKKLDEDYLMDMIKLRMSTAKTLAQVTEEINSNFNKANPKPTADNLTKDAAMRFEQDIAMAHVHKNKKLQLLDDELKAGTIKIQEYNEKRQQIEDDYNMDSLKKERNYYLSILEILEKAGLDTTEVRKQLGDVLMQIDDTETEHHAKSLKDRLSREKEFTDAVKQLRQTLQDTFFAFLDGQVEKQKNALQAQADDIDKRTEAEVDGINRSALTEEEKNIRIQKAQALQASKKEEIDRKQRDLDLKKAKFDRLRAVAGIIQNTAQGITAALAEFPPNIPLAIVVGAIGAAELAQTLATPLPRYARGRENGPAEFAITGEIGREKVTLRDGTSYFTPDRATVTYLPEGAKVTPNHELVTDALNRGLMSSFTPVGDHRASEHAFGQEFTRAMQEHTRTMVSAIKSSKSTTHIHNDPFAAVMNMESALQWLQSYKTATQS